MSFETERERDNRREFAAALRYGAVVIVVALVVLGLCLLWLNGCKTTGDDPLARCSVLQRNTLAIGPSLILLVGGIGAFVRTYQLWRSRGAWVVWQGAGWFLLVLMLVVLTMTAPAALI